MLQFYNVVVIIMSATSNKLFLVGKISLMLIFCLGISLIIGFFSIIYVFGISDCVLDKCQSSILGNIAAYLVLLSPLLIFSIGAYLCRNDINALTKIKFRRVILFLSFALFPIYFLVGFIIYAVNSK